MLACPTKQTIQVGKHTEPRRSQLRKHTQANASQHNISSGSASHISCNRTNRYDVSWFNTWQVCGGCKQACRCQYSNRTMGFYLLDDGDDGRKIKYNTTPITCNLSRSTTTEQQRLRLHSRTLTHTLTHSLTLSLSHTHTHAASSSGRTAIMNATTKMLR